MYVLLYVLAPCFFMILNIMIYKDNEKEINKNNENWLP